MIRLSVKEYCHDCLGFRPVIIKPERMTQLDDNEQKGYTDTIIQCEYQGRCESITRYLMRQLEGKDA